MWQRDWRVKTFPSLKYNHNNHKRSNSFLISPYFETSKRISKKNMIILKRRFLRIFVTLDGFFFDLWHLHWAPIGVGIENGREINTGKLSAYLSPWKSLNISGLRLRAAHNSFSVSPDAAVLVFMPMYPWVKTPMSHRRHPFQSGDACRATLAYITHKSDSKATKSNMCPLSWVFAFWLGREEGR